jgi:hypothetical protein
MGRLGRALCGWVLVAAASAAGPALARGDDPERQARRHELRQQLHAERERWRAEGRGPGGYGAGAGVGRGMGPGTAGEGGWQALRPMPGEGLRPGPGGGHRLSPDERRALRQELRQHRP